MGAITTGLTFQSTLPRGERLLKRKQIENLYYFNPRSHEGSDSAVLVTASKNILFQSTLPRGERRSRSHQHLYTYDFNPRSHEGSDRQSACRHTGRSYFNPRSHEGSDFIPSHKFVKNPISIHAPTRGATSPNGFYISP